MSLPWLENNLILLTKAGSQAYGMAHDKSDLDLRGVAIAPPELRNHLFQEFRQTSDAPFAEERWGHLRRPLNPKMETVIYALDKFVTLASRVNPNIIEIIFTDDTDTLVATPIGQLLREHRNLFLSRRAGYTFLGYATAQLKLINRHRKWLIDPPQKAPSRADFQLPEEQVLANNLDNQVRKRVELLNLHQFDLEDEDRRNLRETIFTIVNDATQTHAMDWDNWPQIGRHMALQQLSNELQLSKELVELLHREAQWKEAQQKWSNYEAWRKGRNPERAEIERKHGFDCKNAAHLVRLTRMGIEILTEGTVKVKRPDAEELLAIRNGAWSYEQVEAYSVQTNAQLRTLEKTSPLPHHVDQNKINDLYQRCLQTFDSTNS